MMPGYSRARLAPKSWRFFGKAAYFFFFAALGSLMPFLALYYRERGFSGDEIGLLLGIQPLIALLSGPIWGGLADATRQYRRLLALMVVGAILSAYLITVTSHFVWFIPIVGLFALCGTPVIALIDSSVLDLLGKRKQGYGRVRIWGTVGWGVATMVTGLLIDRLGLRWGFYAYMLFMVGVLWAAAKLPTGQAKMAQPFWVGVRSLVSGWPWIVFMVTILILNASASMVIAFLFLHLEDLGSSRTLIGLASAVATVSELPVFFFSDRLLRRWGPRGLLIISLVAYAVRALLTASISTPWMILPIQLLHGITFGTMWLAAVAYARDLAPEGLGATAQGMLLAMLNLGASLGNFVAGHYYEIIGTAALFRWSALGMLIGLVFFAAAGRQRQPMAGAAVRPQKALSGDDP